MHVMHSDSALTHQTTVSRTEQSECAVYAEAVVVDILLMVSFADLDKRSPQIVGLRLPMCMEIFQPANFNANPGNILVHLQIL